jgi:plasmid stability protein
VRLVDHYDEAPQEQRPLLSARERLPGRAKQAESNRSSDLGLVLGLVPAHCAISCYHVVMAQLLVRHLDDDVKAKLQRRARRHGHSTEEEVREILRNAVREEGVAQSPLGSRIAARFASVGLAEEIPELRGEPPRPADLEP